MAEDTSNDVVIHIGGDTTGLEESMTKSSSTVQKFASNSEKQLNTLNKIKVNPVVRITDQISAPLKKIEGALGSLKSKASSVFSFLTNPMTMLGGAAAGFGLFELAKSASDYGQQVYQLGAKLNITTGEAESLNETLGLAQVNSQSFTATIMRLDKAVDTAGKSGNATTKSLAAFGVNLKGSNGALMSTTDQLAALAAGYTKAAAAGKEQDYVSQLLGARGQQLIPLFEQYADYAAITSKIKMIGVDPAQAHELYINMQALQEQTKQLGMSFSVAFMPFMNAVAPELLKIMGGIIDFIKQYEPQIESFFGGIGRTVASNLDQAAKAFFGWVNRLANDQTFQKMSLGDKLIYVVDQGLDALNEWLGSAGGHKVEDMFAKLAGLAIKAWGAALLTLGESTIKNLFSGNLLGAAGSGFLFSMLGGGTVLKGAGALGKFALSKTGAGAAMKASVGEGGFLSDTAATLGTEGIANAGRFAISDIALPITALIEAINVFKAKPGQRLAAAGMGAGRVAGMWAGGEAGGELGAVIGTAVGPEGTAVGAAIGALVGSIGGFFGGQAFAGMLEGWISKISFKSIGAKVKDVFDHLPELAAYGIGYLVETIAQLPGKIGSWLSKLPGEFSTWFQSAKAAAIAWLVALPGEIATWILSIPDRVATAFEQVVKSFELFGQDLINGLVKGFTSDTSAAGKWIVDKIIGTEAVAGSLGQQVATGYQAGAKAAKHASGGLFSVPHAGIVAESGPEGIVPLTPSARSLSLYQQVGQRLGLGSGGAQPGHTINLYMDGAVQAQINGTGDLDDMANQVGDITARKLRGALGNLAMT
jgi:hypothetical protein